MAVPAAEVSSFDFLSDGGSASSSPAAVHQSIAAAPVDAPAVSNGLEKAASTQKGREVGASSAEVKQMKIQLVMQQKEISGLKTQLELIQMNMQMMMQTIGLAPPGGGAIMGGGTMPPAPGGGGVLGSGVDQFQQQVQRQLNPLPPSF
jgi:hypothetical protein